MNLSILAILTASMLWGTTGTAQALAPGGAQPAIIGALRLVFGGAGLMLLLLCSRTPLVALRSLPLGTTLAAAAGMGLYQLFFFSSVLKTGVAVGTMVTIGSAPAAAGLIVLIFWRQPPGLRWLVATLLSVTGCAVLVLGNSGSLRIAPPGIAMALAAGFSYAVFTVSAKRLVLQVTSLVAMSAVCCAAALLVSPLLPGADLSWLWHPRGLGLMLYLGLIATAAPYALFVIGLQATPAATATTLTLMEPLTAGMLGIFFLDEPLTLPTGCGIALLMAGLAVLSLGGRSRPEARHE